MIMILEKEKERGEGGGRERVANRKLNFENFVIHFIFGESFNKIFF